LVSKEVLLPFIHLIQYFFFTLEVYFFEANSTPSLHTMAMVFGKSWIVHLDLIPCCWV